MFGRRKNPEPPQPDVMSGPAHDRLMRGVYKMVSCHRDSDAIYFLTDAYDYLQTPTPEFEKLFKHVEQWGPSRTLLCLGRLIIYRLEREKRHDRVIAYIEKCQRINPRFLLPELSRVTFYARQAIELGKFEMAKNLVAEYETRYGNLVGGGECERLLQLIEPDIDVSGFFR
ncbi:MAG TPA: hypothetical protein VKB27_10630 [Gammaproteobacteria bacterium]|nr:hypothetical protein [Gammaproteobacteria bacterium]